MVMSDGLVVAGGGAFVERAALYRLGSALLKRIAREEVVTVPGLAPCCYRAKWVLLRITAGVLTQLPAADAGAVFHPLWRAVDPLRETNQRLLLETAPKGFSPTGCAMRKTKAGS